jgi:hypothetical protein
MVLAESVKDGFLRVLLPNGSALTAENLQQLQAHAVEFICVSYEDKRTAEEIAVHSAETARSVMNIFTSADLSNPVIAALFNQVLIYRSA